MIAPAKVFIDKFKKVTGAFSVCEAIALFNIVMDAPKGTYLELGSHKGKSSMVIAKAMHSKDPFHLVEPEFKDISWHLDVHDVVLSANQNLREIKLIPDYSLNILPLYEDLAFCFVDSGVHDDMVMEEVKMLEDRMKQGGIIAFHDFGNQFTAVQRAYSYLEVTGKYEPIPIDWKCIFNYVREHNLEEGNNSWHEKGSEEFPKFVGALRRK
jgi:hypothetical protein